MSSFFEQEVVRETDDPRLVYICALFQGDAEKNIEFARQKAQEILQAGDVPVCPRLMFPSIADLQNPEQYLAAQRLGLRLVESCQQVNVYGTTLSEEMWAEVNHAVLRGIPVKSDVQAIARAQSHRQAARKNRDAR